jgi:hypothetical protein
LELLITDIAWKLSIAVACLCSSKMNNAKHLLIKDQQFLGEHKMSSLTPGIT